jgi:hypothetical protein
MTCSSKGVPKAQELLESVYVAVSGAIVSVPTCLLLPAARWSTLPAPWPAASIFHRCRCNAGTGSNALSTKEFQLQKARVNRCPHKTHKV